MESDVDLLLDGIKDPIDRLYKLSTWIRNPSPRFASLKALHHQQIDSETNVDLLQASEGSDYDYVSSLFLQYRKSRALEEYPTTYPSENTNRVERERGGEDKEKKTKEKKKPILMMQKTCGSQSGLCSHNIEQTYRRLLSQSLCAA